MREKVVCPLLEWSFKSLVQWREYLSALRLILKHYSHQASVFCIILSCKAVPQLQQSGEVELRSAPPKDQNKGLVHPVMRGNQWGHPIHQKSSPWLQLLDWPQCLLFACTPPQSELGVSFSLTGLWYTCQMASMNGYQWSLGHIPCSPGSWQPASGK